MRIAVVILLLALALGAQTLPSYRQGRVVKITSEIRSEASVTAPQETEGTPPRHPEIRNHGEVFYISIQNGNALYVAEVRSGAPGFDPQVLSAHRAVAFRIEGNTIYIRAPKEREFSARLIPEFRKHRPALEKPQSPPSK